MSYLDVSIRLDDDVPRCPNCGKRLDTAASACPACGYEMIPHRARVRCRHCGNRIPADAEVCPRCKADRSAELERAASPSRIPALARLGAGVVASLLLICCGWIVFRAFTTNTLARMLGAYEPTRTPTQVIQIIYVVATPVPPTSMPSPMPSATATSRFSPTPTRRGAKTSTPTPTVAPSSYPAPRLVSPANTTVYTGADVNIVLEWQSVAPSSLRENEWYAISISYTARDGKPGAQTRWTKETRWTVPNAWWNEAAPDARSFKWGVTVVRVAGIDPLSSPSRTPISPESATRTFFWH